ncbi:MAG: hypothetical protein R6V01_00450 [Thermoplasmatota archaeon]
MKVVVENIIASCKVAGDLHMDRIRNALEGSKYQPSLFEGVIYSRKDPNADIFLHKDGVIKLHGATSEEKIETALNDTLKILEKEGIHLRKVEPLKIKEVIASFTLDGSLDPKSVYEEFKDDGVIYDPGELPGFILHVGKNIEVLIFPEGKIVSKGSDNLLDAISSLQMVENRIEIGGEDAS